MKLSFRGIMYKFFLSSVIYFLALAVQAQPSREAFEALLRDEIFTSSDVALVAYDLDADSLLFSHRANKLCRPASVLKVVTSLAALERLGTDYTVNTYLLRNGTNLYVKGETDPLFSYEDLKALLSSVPRGMVVDTLFADCSFMDSIYWGPGWAWDDTPWEFQPYISPLMLCGGCVEVKAIPSRKGEKPVVECYPPSGFYSVANEAVSNAGTGEKFTILRDWLEGTNVIRLRGDCRAPKSEKMNMFPSQNYFMAVAKELLDSLGVPVCNVAFSAAPVGCDTLAVVHRAVEDIVVEALMESDNLCAEALSYHLGALYGKRPVRQDMGPKIIKGFMEYTFSMPEWYDVCDGSGLSPYTLLSADIVLQVLKRVYALPEVYSVFMRGLPQSGVSGTMKHRTKGTAAYKKVFAKTGTVTGVCTLAGFAKAANGHTIAFVMLNDGLPKASPVRAWQDKVCNLLCR